ncbi:MAG: helix-turn-helix transcriptional regulator [Acholeplasmataceae bacterium]|nr:helix-turn-helix transcriptional regulator [Acholeplasmataceae bacterium]MDD4203919.1 helix-turn-helix transcriptional regulator [Acholeplasmataceae bacterium]
MQETFGVRFQRFRKAKNLTQEDIANKFNISPQAVSKWENDISYPDITILSDLSELLGVSLDELLGKTTEPTVIQQRTEPKDFKDMILRIVINDSDGSKVKVNLPISLIKLGLHSNFQVSSTGNKEILKDIDFDQIIKMAESGLIGKLVEIEDEDGTTVDIFID